METAELFLDVSINGQPSGIIAGFVQMPDGRMSAKASELREAGIDPGTSTGAEDIVVLEELTGISYAYDPEQQTIDFTAGDEKRVVKSYDASGRMNVELDPTGTGSVLSYGAFAGGSAGYDYPWTDAEFNGASVSLDHIAYGPAGELANNWIVGPRTSSDAPALRLDTVISRTDRAEMRTASLGDFITGGLSWTRPIRMGGAQVRRNFGVRPDLITMPMPSVSGSAAVPSTVDVYVNNIKTFSQEVGSGPFFISNIPVISGSGEARIVVRDPQGRETETVNPFATSADLLRPGLYDYSLGAGFARLDYGEESFSYGNDVLGSLSIRYGLTDRLTGEFHAEAGAGLAKAGAGAVFSLGNFGILEASAAGSLFDAMAGLQLGAQYDTTIRGVDVSLSSLRSFGPYRDLAYAASLEDGLTEDEREDIAPDRAQDRIGAGFALPQNWGMFGLNLLHIEDSSGDHSFYVSSNYTRRLFEQATLSLTGYLSLDEDQGAGIALDLSAPLGRVGYGSLSGSSSESGSTAALSVAKARGNHAGSVGWRAQAQLGDDSAAQGQISYRSTYADAELYAALGSENTTLTAYAEGSVVLSDNALFLSRRIDGPFAIVDAGAPDVSVSLENSPVGKTGKSGKLLVPGLRPYQQNKLAIDVADLPITAEYGTTEKEVTPGAANGVFVGFGVSQNAMPAVVTFVDQDGKPLEPGSAGVMASTGEEFVVGYDGQAWIRSLAADNEARIETGEGICTARFDHEASSGEQGFIPAVKCS